MMKRILHFAAPALLFAATIFGAVAGTVTITPPTSWPKTDVATDPSAVFGTLPNGMRYLIKPNTHPEHAVSFMLRIATGSFDETPKTAGVSHFIEHMIFRGTTHIPDGEAFKRLEKLGLAAGADANAFTGADATIYTFDFPGNDATTLDTALTLTRDIASEVQFDPKAVDSERQVVLSEFRLRDTAQLRMSRATHKAMYGEALANAYFAIGTQDSLNATTADDLKAYYRAHYRPERAVLIVVGNVDAKALETEIQKRFSDWKASAPKPPVPTFTTPDPPKATSIHLFVENGANAAVQMTWVNPFDPTPETRARDARDTVREIALRILNLRLHALATSADPPFLQAGAAASNSYRTSFLASLGAAVGSGDPKRALKAMRQTLMTVLHDGVTQDEVDLAIAQHRTTISSVVTAAPSRRNNQLTNTFNGAIGKDDVIDGPENWMPTFEDAVKGLTAVRVTAELRQLYLSTTPIVLVSSPSPVTGGADALLAAYNEAGTLAPAAPAVARAPVAWPYTDFGPAGTITSQKTVDDLGVTLVQFANGVRATIKSTKFQEGQVQVLVRVGHGRFAMARDKVTPRWALPGSWSHGGIGRIATADLPRALNGRQWGATPEIADSAFQLVSQTRPADLETNLQLVGALITDPAWRPEGLAQIKSATETGLAQTMTTPGGVFGLHYWEYLHNNDRRWAPPTPEEVKTTSLDAVKELATADLANGPIEVVIVGDVSVDDVLAYLKRTLGALPKRKVDTKPLAGREVMPEGGAPATVLHHTGKTHEALAMLGWRTTGVYPDPQASRVLRIIEAVIRTRLFDQLRTKEGITYSPQATSANSRATQGWGVLTVAASVPETKLADFYAAARKVAADLATTELTAEEFERARGPLVTEVERAQQTDTYWVHALAGLQVDPRTAKLVRERISGLKAITSADVLKAAQKYLKDERSLRLMVVPEAFTVPPELLKASGTP
jgi:zinc protease